MIHRIRNRAIERFCPLDVCFGPDGSFAVLNDGYRRGRQVVIFDRDGEYSRSFGSRGRGQGPGTIPAFFTRNSSWGEGINHRLRLSPG